MIDIILTNYNRESLVTRAINSIFNQTYKDIHLIIVDDCSTDNSCKVVEELLENGTYSTKITFIKNKVNVGAGVSRGIGLKYLKGKYMTFLDSDDYLQKDFIEKMVSYTKREYDIITHNCLIDLNVGILEREDTQDIDLSDNKFKVITYCKFLNGTLIRNKLWKKVKYSQRRYLEDTPTYFKLVFYAKKVIHTKIQGYVYTQNSPDSLCRKAKENNIRESLYKLVTLVDEYDFLLQNKDYKLAEILNKKLNHILESDNPLELLTDINK